jgi:hypothetical protein
MGKVDVAARAYLSDPARFADLFNHEAFGGDEVIHPSELREADTTKASGNTERRRDLLKRWARLEDDKAAYAILGLENQTRGHPAMPVRCALYDAMVYGAQVREIAKKNKESGVPLPTSAERLSGMREGDRLRPVVTIVLYLSASDWTWPETLHGTIDPAADGHLMAMVPDYRMNLVVPRRMPDEELDAFSTDVGLALKYIKHSSDKEELGTMVHEDERFGSVDPETAEFLNVVTGSNLAIRTEGGRVDMCKAIDDMRRDERLEGRLEGRQEGRREGERKGLLKSLRSLTANTGWELAKAFDMLSVPESERASLADELGAAT